MLTVSNVSKGYGGKTLFSDLSLQFNRQDRLGLVGPNGAGKSTLFKLILQLEEPDDGLVTFQRGTTVGFLPQESAPVGDQTVMEIATSQHAPGSEPEDDYDSYADGPAIAKAKRLLKGLAFRETDFDRPARELSGGWVMRAHLARLLVHEPDILMLDEPTNHLDLETLIWFQGYLKNYPGAILVISHDREFLNQLVTGIVEIRNERLYTYFGNYDAFLDEREAQQEQQLAAFKNQQREIGRLMDFVNRFRAKNTTATRAQAKLKQIDRMEKINAPEQAASTVDFAFPQPEKSGQRVITLKGVNFAYGQNVIYTGLEFEAQRGDRTVLVGPNGSGKSTLIKLLAGNLTPQAGDRDLGLRVKVGYFSQYRTEMLQPERTVLEEASDTAARVTDLYIRSLLGCFLFRDDDVFKKVAVLSGGEKTRLALVKLLLDPPNLLLMDEPTTHLDVASIDALVAALSEFIGTLVFISHDVYFIRAIATRVLHISGGVLTPYAGDYDYYLEKTKASSARVALTSASNGNGLTNARPATSGPAVSSKPVITSSSKERRQQAAEARKAMGFQKKHVTTLEARIASLEAKQVQLTAEMEKPETYTKPGRSMEIQQQIRAVGHDLHKVSTDWEAAATKLAELEAASVE
ncbi:MAG: ABC-F family ATP-binding cassette domain-containing protein [Verrucomicrobia bacterium]|nr:ABC-F family ATP-binding cassette domain-containing protein [Verrucomicrobiota bacterium]